jgi:hypothetical protein
MTEQHDAVRLAQSLCNPIVECQVLRRALPMFAQFVAVVQMMQEVMRIVRRRPNTSIRTLGLHVKSLRNPLGVRPVVLRKAMLNALV